MSAPLTPGELAAVLLTLPSWRLEGSALVREWRFGSFPAAIAFIQAAAPDIDRLGHHPEWTNVYDRVRVRLTTHDAGNLVTGQDVALARLLEQHAAVRLPGV